MTAKEEIWSKWTDQYINTDESIPLFETDEGLNVHTRPTGKTIGVF